MTAINSNRAIRGPVTAVPVVAGKGVRLVADTVNNRWVAEADETVLYTGSSSTSPIVLSEVITNFEYIEITWEHNYNSTIINNSVVKYAVPTSELFAYGGRIASSGFVWFIAAWSVGSDNKTLTRSQSKYITITNAVGTPADNNNLFPIKVVGINRIQGGA